MSGFGIFSVTFQALNLLYKEVDGWREYSDEVPDLAQKLRYYSECLQRLNDYFTKLADPETHILPASAQEEVEQMGTYLGSVSAKCQKLSAELSATGWRRAFGKLGWKLRQDKVRRVLGLLKDWAAEFEIHLVAIPDEVRYKYNLRAKSNDSTYHASGIALKEHMKTVLANGSKIKIENLQLEHVAQNPNETSADRKRRLALRYPQRSIVKYHGQVSFVEYHSYSKEHENDIKMLADILHSARPLAHGILRCETVYEDNARGWGLVYSIPKHLIIPRGRYTLRSMLMISKESKKILHPLNERFRIAKTIAMALFYVHCGGWVHKSIRSSNIVMLEPVADDAPRFARALGSPFLVGFEYARGNEMSSTPEQGSDEADENDIVYKHPDQSPARYEMSHDVYSLGVVLLEIGLWTPLELASLSGDQGEQIALADIKKQLVNRAKAGSVEVKMGRRYQNLVVRCLQTGDNADAGGVRYIENVVDVLAELSDAMNTFE